MKRKGFTLIELLAVIVILAIILAIAVPSISNMISSSTKSAFESNAKLVLKSVNYKKLENNSFDETEVTKDNISTLLGLSSDNYESLNIIKEDGNAIISIVGKNKWNGLVACGTSQNMKIVTSLSDCSGDLIPPVITLNGSSSVNINQGDIYTDQGATALDNKDGDITSKIIITSNVNPDVPGTYTVTYSVTDSALNKTILTRTVIVMANYAGPEYINSKNVNGPVLASGMTPIKWNGTTWVDTTTTDNDWYNYDTTSKKWANAKTADGSMWVWIPRYIYKVSSGWHTSTTGTIEVQFSKGTNDNWNSAVIGSIDIGNTAEASNNKWTNHPAFTFGTTELTGIWVAKFEATAAEGVANGYYSDWSCPNVGDDVTTKTVKSVPNATSWRCQTIEKAFAVSRNMETTSAFGWGTTGAGIDTHLIKNVEWGAITYLSKSVYGKNEEVWINNSQTFTTGCAGDSQAASAYAGCQNAYNTTNGVKASTTGNIYGVYDMFGGALDRVAGYLANDHSNLTTYGALLFNSNVMYKDIYAKGATDNASNNYALFANKKGDALYEITSNTDGTYSWFGDAFYAPTNAGCFVGRGGYFSAGSTYGIFSLTRPDGAAFGSNGFRPVLLVGSGL